MRLKLGFSKRVFPSSAWIDWKGLTVWFAWIGLRVCWAVVPYHLEEAANQELTINCQIVAATRLTGNPAELLLPKIPERETQKFNILQTSVPAQIITDQSDPPKPILSAWVKGQMEGNNYVHRYQATLNMDVHIRQRQLVAGPGDPVQPLTLATENRFLETSPTLNWKDPRFVDWLADSGLHRDIGESQLYYARRLYHYLLEHARYEYPPATSWEAAATCKRLRTDCGGLSGVFVSACRANHIPARLLIGQWFRLKTICGKHKGNQPHVYAEFFAPNIGWVPVDLASALMFKDEPDALPDYFGIDPPFFLVLTYDTDFRLDTPGDGLQKVQWMQSPSLWFTHSDSDAPDVYRHWMVSVAN